MPNKELGQRLKQLREAAGMSQADLAKAAGVPIGSLRNWEYGRREPLLSAAGQLAAALGVDIAELLQPLAPDQEAEPPPKKGRPRKKAAESSEAAESTEPTEGTAEEKPAEGQEPKKKGGKRRKKKGDGQG